MSHDKIEVSNLYKIFGPNPQNVMRRVQKGMGKDEVLSKTGHTVGLDNITLSIREGETFVVMGLSGSGKSTLIRCLNRLIEPTHGHVRIDGQDITTLTKRQVKEVRRHQMGMVFQRFALMPHKNILDNVAYGLAVQGVPKVERRKRARHWIEVVGLKGYEKSRPRQLSGGMQQRVGLARALCTDPAVLLMDEAFSALDPLIRREMQDELIRLQKELHKTIVFITHDLDEALRLGDRVAILKDGQLVQIGTPEEILNYPANDYVADFIQDVNRAKVITAGSMMREAVTVGLYEDPQAVLEHLHASNQPSAIVIDSDSHVAGSIHVDDLHEGGMLESLLHATSAVTENSVIESFWGDMAAHDVPIAVVDDDGRVMGMVVRGDVLGVLSKEVRAVQA